MQDDAADAQYLLGRLYFFGKGIRQNYNEAFKWYELAAKNEFFYRAQCEVGKCYENGFGTKKDLFEAFAWYEASASGGDGDEEAMYNLGRCYEKGLGVKKDLSKAFEWYSNAAEQGYKDAQYKLGNCYYNGEGVKQDYREAFKYFRDAKISYDRNDMKFLCRYNNVCQHCGGTFEGKLFKKCSKCGKVKNYISFKHKK